MLRPQACNVLQQWSATSRPSVLWRIERRALINLVGNAYGFPWDQRTPRHSQRLLVLLEPARLRHFLPLPRPPLHLRRTRLHAIHQSILAGLYGQSISLFFLILSIEETHAATFHSEAMHKPRESARGLQVRFEVRWSLFPGISA